MAFEAINTIIFSKNRAMQLDLLLHSILVNASRLWPPRIIYKCTNTPFCQAYEILKSKYDAYWIPQTPEAPAFKDLLLNALRDRAQMTMMLVDDDIFYRPLPHFRVNRMDMAYAPRLGRNCTYCLNVHRAQRLPNGLVRESLTDGDLDFDCTMSVDGHVYMTEYIWPHLVRADYDNPSDIEHALYQDVRPTLMFGQQSCLVGVPHNRVSAGSCGAWAMGGRAEDLNEQYLAGKRISLEQMDFSGVNGVHCPLNYVVG